MTHEVMRRAVDAVGRNAKAAKNRTLGVSIHGGDVGACWGLFTDTVDYIREVSAKLGLKAGISLGTNAFYNPEQASYIVENINGATVSLDGLPSVHDRYRTKADGGPSSPEVLRTLSLFDDRGFRYSIRMTVMADTVEQLPESVQFICSRSKAKQIRAEPMYLRGRAALESGLQSPSPERFVARFGEARRVAESRGRILSYSGLRLGKIVTSFCSQPQPICGVTPDGDLTSCYEVVRSSDPLWDSFVYGRIDGESGEMQLDQNRLDEIRDTAVRRQEGCRDCFCWSHCAGDCAVKAMSSAAARKLPDRCLITRRLSLDGLLSLLEQRELGRVA